MNAPQTSLPPHSSHTFSGMIADHLNALLAQYAQSGTPITACELRDELLQHPALDGADSKTVYLKVRDRLRSLTRQGLTQRVGVQGKHRPIFQILDLPEDCCPSHEAPPLSPHHSTEASSTATARSCPPATHAMETSRDFAEFLSHECHRLKLDMQAALGEASHYAHILSQYPDQQALIQPLHEAACQRGSEAKGALDAVITLRKQLGEEAAS